MAESNEFGGRLFALREENDINKTELAKVLKMSRSMITMYESGERMPSTEVLLKISDYYSVSIDWLLGRTENKQLTANRDHVPLDRTVKIPIIKTVIIESTVDSLQNIVASSLLGHSRASFTQDTYQHTLDEMKYKTAKKISSRLLKKVDKDKKNSPQG